MSIIGLYKATQHIGTEKLRKLVDGKRVAVVGNAQSLFGKGLGTEIDAHDIVIRLNRGFIVDPAQQGSRTDIVGTAHPLSLGQVEQYNPKLIYWLFWRWWRIPTWNMETWAKTEIVPISHWRMANSKLSQRPTSGFVMVNTLLHFAQPQFLTVFGFDFYRSGNFYRGGKISKSHDHSDEEKAFAGLANSHQGLGMR